MTAIKKELLKTVEKVWGDEVWLVNNDLYCGKLLIIDKGAESSYHYHKTKTETFWCLEGYATLIVEGREHMMAAFTRPKTIYPYEKHKFIGITQAIFVEISTTHDDNDVVRIKKSKAGENEN